MEASQSIFNKTEVSDYRKLPDDLRGSIAITRDEKSIGMFHKLFKFFQTIDNNTMRNGQLSFGDINLCHSFIILDNKADENGNLHVAHADAAGLIKEKRNYLGQNDVTSIVIYTPKDKEFAELLAKNAEQCQVGETAKYAYKHLMGTLFHKKERQRAFTKNRTKYLGHAVAHLMNGEQIKDKKGTPLPLICTGFVLTNLQATVLMHKIRQTPQSLDLKDREFVKATAARITDLIKQTNTPLGSFYHQHPLMGFGSKRMMPKSLGLILNEVSESK